MSSLLKKLRYLWFGLRTVLGWSSKGYFIPYRYFEPDKRLSYESVCALFQSMSPHFQSELGRLDKYTNYDHALGLQDWFPGLDAAYLYAFMRDLKPKRILEVGSGHSTHIMVNAIREGGLSTTLTCIDPVPRRPLKEDSVKWVKSILSLDHQRYFDELEAGDVLFIDSSHILMPGTDVDLLFNHFLPRLPSGVVIHIHDVFLPHPYPDSWGWRGYNEQSLVATLILGGGYMPHFSSHWMKELTQVPCNPTSYPSSLWVIKK